MDGRQPWHKTQDQITQAAERCSLRNTSGKALNLATHAHNNHVRRPIDVTAHRNQSAHAEPRKIQGPSIASIYMVREQPTDRPGPEPVAANGTTVALRVSKSTTATNSESGKTRKDGRTRRSALPVNTCPTHTRHQAPTEL